jgi:hypothetical protein
MRVSATVEETALVALGETQARAEWCTTWQAVGFLGCGRGLAIAAHIGGAIGYLAAVYGF